MKGSTSEDHGKAHSAEPSACQLANAPDFAQRPTRTLSETFYTGGLGEQVTAALQIHTDLAAWHRDEQRIDAVEISVQSVSSCSKYGAWRVCVCVCIYVYIYVYIYIYIFIQDDLPSASPTHLLECRLYLTHQRFIFS